MKVLWDHIDLCNKKFQGYFLMKWIGIKTDDIEFEIKGLFNTLRQMKVEKRANAYVGILDDIKKWQVFIPLIADLAIPDMKDRHWDDLKKRINGSFVIDDKLILKDIYDLNLG